MDHDILYSNKPVNPKMFPSFMPDLCKNAGTHTFTAHFLRTTAITAMSDEGLTKRNIMFISDHKCEESLKSYRRRLRTPQKKVIYSPVLPPLKEIKQRLIRLFKPMSVFRVSQFWSRTKKKPTQNKIRIQIYPQYRTP